LKIIPVRRFYGKRKAGVFLVLDSLHAPPRATIRRLHFAGTLRGRDIGAATRFDPQHLLKRNPLGIYGR
jgi:hypothetical protein